MNSELGKKAESKIQEWLTATDGCSSFDRLPDQMTGFYGSKNICDFIYYKYPNQYYIESKATYEDRFDFSMITDFQYDGLKKKSRINGVYGLVIVLFASYKRAFVIDIREISRLREEMNIKSLNIKKIDSWKLRYAEIPTILNTRKQLLDYTGNLEDLILKSRGVIV